MPRQGNFLMLNVDSFVCADSEGRKNSLGSRRCHAQFGIDAGSEGWPRGRQKSFVGWWVD